MIKKNLMLKKLNEDNIDEIMSLQDDIFSELQAENFLRKNSKENFIKCLQEPSYTIGLYDGDKLIGLTILADVKDTEESLSKSIIKTNINNAINCKLTVIRKEYSGNGFQRDMHWLREKLAYKNGFKYLCTSVDPNNHFSRNNIIKTGFIYDHTQEKYGGLTRDIFFKEVSVKEYEDKIKPLKDIIDENIDLDNCYQSEISLLTIGDIIEYKDGNKEFYTGNKINPTEINKVYFNPSK